MGNSRNGISVLVFAAIFFFSLGSGCSGSNAGGKGRKGKTEGTKESRQIAVRAVAFSPDAKLLAVAIGPPAPIRKAILPKQRTIQLWEVDSGKLLHTLEVDNPAKALFFGQNGKKLLACHNDQVTIFDVGSGTKDADNQLGGIPLAMLPDGKKLLLYSDSRALELWDPFTAKLLKKFSGTSHAGADAAISPDGKWALVPCIPHQAKPKPIDPTILQLWELSNGKLISSFGLESKLQRPLAFFPSSKYAVAQRLDEMRPDGNHNYSLVVLKIPSGKVTRSLEGPLRGRQEVAFSANGKEVVVCDEPGPKPSFHPPHLRRLEVESGKELWNVELPLSKEGEGVMVCTFSADGSRFFRARAGGGWDISRLGLEIWDGVAGKKLRDLTSEPPQ
jgi:WD40 repeat protein